ncbi:MAG TPA: nucleoside monophosphate kinase [Candidatus Moranbacteria bacterium]|jgi:adenylate kinase|nr:nucleoside monophosphate kinase [Candidatus Moranbacteria bacterium]HOF42667.1 nucleoside monophosphate kinase [Candidatus Moranbacteria bacterium]HPX94425.1 nucleoside monophosphate kinase [Candidatus Moranbacteria bacterium]HQB59435.1 nucleoside monophosphate kinase [Candidatus Moranbacteria bacterium]
MNLVIFGPQGCGKGTQAKKLCAKFGLVHIETGQIFREIAKEKTELGQFIYEMNEKKEMIPDDITMKILSERLKEISDKIGIIIDSAPRTTGQIEPLEKMLEKLARPIHKAISITLPHEESLKRISKRFTCIMCRKQFVLGESIKDLDNPCPDCGGLIAQRIDDTPDGIIKRLDTFQKVTVPVIEYYRKKNMLIEVDGTQNIDKVFEDIASEL